MWNLLRASRRSVRVNSFWRRRTIGCEFQFEGAEVVESVVHFCFEQFAACSQCLKGLSSIGLYISIEYGQSWNDGKYLNVEDKAETANKQIMIVHFFYFRKAFECEQEIIDFLFVQHDACLFRFCRSDAAKSFVSRKELHNVCRERGVPAVASCGHGSERLFGRGCEDRIETMMDDLLQRFFVLWRRPG